MHFASEFLYSGSNAVVPVDSLLRLDKALVNAEVSNCCKEVALELELALNERSLGIPLAGDDLCEVLVRSDNGEGSRGSGVLANAALVIDANIVLNINIEPEGGAVGVVGPYLGVGKGVELAGLLLGELGQNICAQLVEPFLVYGFCHNNFLPYDHAVLREQPRQNDRLLKNLLHYSGGGREKQCRKW